MRALFIGWSFRSFCDMKSTHLFHTLILLIVLTQLWSFSVPKFRFSSIVQRSNSCSSCSRHNFKLSAVGSEEDISPAKDNSIIKTLLREGLTTRSYPIVGDTVDVKYKIIDFATGALIHDSSHGPKNGETEEGLFPMEGPEPKAVRVVRNLRSLSFKVGTDPLQAVIGWDIAVRTMRLGEVASFVMEPNMAFGAKGLPDLVPPDTKLAFEFELLDIVPDWTLEYDSLEDDKGFKEQLQKEMETGESPLHQTVYGKQSSPRSFGSGLPGSSGLPDLDAEIVSEKTRSAGASSAPESTGSYGGPKYHPRTPHIRVSEPPPVEQLTRPDGTQREFYDPDRHRLDTSAEVSGQAEGYQWKETFYTMDIEIPLKLSEDVKQAIKFCKSDVLVNVNTTHINVRHRDGRPLLVGPLQGKINPHEVSWALAEYGIADTYKYKAFQCLQITLEKGVLYIDIWATVLNREYLDSLLTPEQKAAFQAEIEMHNRKPPPKPAVEEEVVENEDAKVEEEDEEEDEEEEVEEVVEDSSLPLNDDEEMSYVDYEVDDEGKVISQSTGTTKK